MFYENSVNNAGFDWDTTTWFYPGCDFLSIATFLSEKIILKLLVFECYAVCLKNIANSNVFVFEVD